MLVADGRFKWTSTAEELLGSDIPGMHAEWRSVTLEELLRHRGGAPSVPAPARATFAYSNQGYAIVGRMIEVASGKDFESLLAERLLVPLNIKDFGFGIPMKANESSPSGHAADATPRDMDNPNAIAPTGTLHMPVGEWAKFISFHLGASPPVALLQSARFQRMALLPRNTDSHSPT
jgi:CubicO group peptidase (beta-lactamase class C family)